MGCKWNNIKEKKVLKDVNMSWIYVKFGCEIYVVVKQGEFDLELNQVLKVVFECVKMYSVLKNIIECVIEKVKGGVEENFDELCYEGFGLNGLMIIVDVLMNNVNCMVFEVCVVFGKNGGNMGVSGFVVYMFDVIVVIGVEGKMVDEVLELLMEVDVDVCDILEEDDSVIVYVEFD